MVITCCVSYQHYIVIALIRFGVNYQLWAQVVISDLGGAISCQNMGANKYHKYPPIHIPAQTGQGRAHLVSCTTRDKYSEKTGSVSENIGMECECVTFLTFLW